MVTIREEAYIRCWDEAVRSWNEWVSIKGGHKSPLARVVYARYRKSLEDFATAATRLTKMYPHKHVGPARVANGE